MAHENQNYSQILVHLFSRQFTMETKPKNFATNDSYMCEFFQKLFDPDNRNTSKTNVYPKINILMPENIGQKGLIFL